jgi:phosphopantothenoylcysteine decarboxylase / phosphopantothenate---cysteine ligase
MGTLSGKTIVICITGSIAAYKSAELARQLKKEGAIVTVVMTKNATRFISPYTFETLTGNRVIWDMFSQPGMSIDHISLGQESDLVMIAPATANIIAKVAHGLADDFVSTLMLAAICKKLLCPAMDKEMFKNGLVQSNISKLKEMGFIVMEPEEGLLASGLFGLGRFPDPSFIVEKTKYILSEKDLSGLRLLVTAGPTIEYIDPVRIVTNRSTGKMGYAVARAGWTRGAEVTLISGPTSINPPRWVNTVNVETAEEMHKAVIHHYKDSDVVIKAAAVSDYKPKGKLHDKEKKHGKSITIEMSPTVDILKELGNDKGGRILVGFAAETTDHEANAIDKIQRKNLDLIVVNDVSMGDRGFASDKNEVTIIDREGNRERIPLMPKLDVANRILDRIVALRKS